MTTDDTLAGRIMVCRGGERDRLLPLTDWQTALAAGLTVLEAEQHRVGQALADLFAGVRAVGLVPLGGPVQRAEQAEHRGFQVEIRVEYPGPAAVFDQRRHYRLILAA